jgi:hypothetical protein
MENVRDIALPCGHLFCVTCVRALDARCAADSTTRECPQCRAHAPMAMRIHLQLEGDQQSPDSPAKPVADVAPRDKPAGEVPSSNSGAPIVID